MDAGAAESVVDSAGAADSLVAEGAADSLLDGAVEPLAASDEADSVVLCDTDSVVLCDIDSDVDSVAESLVAPLPGAKAVLPSVARVFRLAAVTS